VCVCVILKIKVRLQNKQEKSSDIDK